MPLKLLRTLMSNWINVEDDIDHDQWWRGPKMIPEMVTLTRYVLWHRWSYTGTLEMMMMMIRSGVWSWRQWQCTVGMFLMYVLIVRTRHNHQEHLRSVSVRPSHNITSYKTAQCSHVTPSREKTDDWERIYKVFGNISHFDCLPELWRLVSDHDLRIEKRMWKWF